MMEQPAAPTPEDQQKADMGFAEDLLDKIVTREKELQDTGWWKNAKEVSEIYEMSRTTAQDKQVPYNILYSNTEVLLPSLYSSTPKPDVRARFKDVQLKPIPQVLERFLNVAADSGQPGFESLDGAMADCTLSALVPGAGVMRIRHFPDAAFPLSVESVRYDCFIPAKARKWAKTPWIAFKHELPPKAFQQQMGLTDEDLQAEYVETDENKKSGCCVYEVWVKAKKEVWFISPDWRSKFIKKTPDPLRLAGFYPTPGYLMLTAKAGQYEPVPLYTYYRNQAEELNRVTVRLNKVLSAIRVRGAYSSLLGDDFAKLLGDGQMENNLVAAADSAMLQQGGGFDKLIWMLPIDKFITVAQQLYTARESIKQVIYEITGISDIIRGSSVASETATAQDLKNKWGTVRLRRMQTLVANYARDIFRLLVDAGLSVIPPEQWKAIVQMPEILTAQEQQALVEKMSQLQATQGQMEGPPPPQLMQMQQQAQAPTMEAILQKIGSDIDRSFTVNIQTSSTIDLDTAADKAEITEFMNAMGQLLGGIQPLAQLGPEGFNAAKAILLGVCKRFKFGIEIADALGAIQAPPQQQQGEKGPSPEEQAALKAESEAKMQKVQMDMQINAAKSELAMAQIEAEKKKLAMDMEKAELQMAVIRAKARAQVMQAAQPPQPPQGRKNANV